METLGTVAGIPDKNRRRAVIEKARAKGKQAAGKKRQKLSPEAQRRVSEKIETLVRTGEVPNTSEGRAQAAAIAHSYERRGKLGRGGRVRK